MVPGRGVPGFGASNRTNLLSNFLYHHAQYTIVIPEEGNWLYPKCPKYDMFVSHRSHNNRNLVMDFCQRGEERKRRHLVGMSHRRGQSWKSQTMVSPSTRSPPSSMLGELSWWKTTTDHRWSTELFQPQMVQFTYATLTVPVKGTQFRVHALGSKTLFWINWNIPIHAAESGACIDTFLFCFMVLR